ncbi:MAG: GGDEF domain-containing protein [Deltaproteobacteria bacterium]|nr:GGDEF domain-containing protein [Deltaproteobacteria bacterium]
MTDPDRNPALPNDEGRLFSEIEDLAERISRQDASALSKGPVMALIRLLSGTLWEQWPRRSAELGLQNWLAISLPPDRYPLLRRLQEQLDELARARDLDGLTGLPNRRAFDRALTLERRRSARLKLPLTLCILDLDNFKTLNDVHGHPCGDTILRTMAQILQEETRQTDTCARLGGEEFGLVLSGTGLARSKQLLERIRERVVSTRVFCHESAPEVGFSFSAGMAGHRGKADVAEDALYRAADEALYRAKAAGRDRVEAAPIMDIPTRSDETLVLADEKRFLFDLENGSG